MAGLSSFFPAMGVQLPDIAGETAKNQTIAANTLALSKARRDDERAQALQGILAQIGPGLASSDPAKYQQAFGVLTGVDPKLAMEFDKSRSASRKDQVESAIKTNEFAGQASQTILSAQPELRPMLYQTLMQKAKALNLDMTGAPPQYDENFVKMTAASATKNADQLLAMREAPAYKAAVTAAQEGAKQPFELEKLGVQAGNARQLAIDEGKIGRLPPTLQKDEATDLSTVQTVTGINSDLGRVHEQITSGKLDLGMLSNFISRGANAIGASTEQSRNFASMQATLEKLRNDSLRLNAGTQTEGDAVRAWNELLPNLNDPELVKQRLKEIQALNERAATFKMNLVNQRRRDNNVSPLDIGAVVPGRGEAKPKAAQNAGAAPAGAVELLRKNPALKSQFDAKYGTGAADRILGGQ